MTKIPFEARLGDASPNSVKYQQQADLHSVGSAGSRSHADQ